MNSSGINRKRYYLIFTIVFLLLFSFIHLYLALNGKTNINALNDGMNQHFRSLLYYSDCLKNGIKSLFIDHKFVFPLWSFSIGEGSDVISVLHNETIGDPLMLLSVFFPAKNEYVFYLFNAFIRIYLAGLFFSELCFYFNKYNQYAVLAGSLVYSFCFWALNSITMHVQFLTPLMYMPLFILGIEKIINNDKPYLFIITVFLGSISFIYYFYMEALATAIFGITRLILKYKTNIKAIASSLIKILLCAVTGIMMGMIIVLPVALSYMGDARMGYENWLSLLYPPFFYERLFTIFVSNDSPYDLWLGYASASLLAISLLLKNYKKHKMLLFFNMLCFIFVCFPIFGKIWNGFSYVSERWCFIISLPVAMNVVCTWDDYQENKRFLVISMFVIMALSMYSAWARNERVIIPIILCAVFLIISLSQIKIKFLSLDFRQVLMITIIAINSMYIFEYNLSPRGGDVIDDLLSIDDARNFNSLTEAYEMKRYLADEGEFSRYTGNYLTNNATITFGLQSTSFYWSISNPYEQVFRKKLDLLDRFSNQYIGYDNRAELETLANVKYYISQDVYDSGIPYGFDYVQELNGYKLYKNQYYIPFGYSYTDSISYETWDQLNTLEKQKAMMNYIVLDNGSNLGKNDYGIEEFNCVLKSNENTIVNKNEIIADQKNSSVVIELPSCNADKENYLLIEGLNYIDSEGIVEDDLTESHISIAASNGSSSYFTLKTKQHRYYYGKEDYCCYLGNTNEPIKEITITFSLPGIYTFGNISFFNSDMDYYSQKTKELSENHLENVLFEPNKVSGTIVMDDNKYLLLSIPYSKGWKAFVDGKEAELLEGNEHYLALAFTKGKHDIKLEYMTPGLIPGLFISFATLTSFLVYIVLNEKKVRKV